jgi:YegS C-terminal NAD kinase beta sandwich-like domain
VTIGPGEEWGRPVAPPARMDVATSDAEVVRLLHDDSAGSVMVTGGDLARTLGTPPPEPRETVLELPIDLLEIATDRGAAIACAHVLVRSSWSRGGWWHGPVIAVMNAQFVGDWDVAPRGHPNDGRAEVVEADELSLRDRLAVRRRLPHGTHVPHPGITVRPVRAASWEFSHDRVVSIDGAAPFPTRSLSITVLPDAAVILH